MNETENNDDDGRIPKDVLDRAHRKLCRMVAANIIAAMGAEDIGFAQMAARLGIKEFVVRRWIKNLMDGTTDDLRIVSDMACALGAQVNVNLQRIPYENIDDVAKKAA